MRLSEITLPEMNGGINTRDPVYNIADNQSPDMLNLWYRDKALVKRDGQTLAAAIPDVYRISPVLGGYHAVHAGDKLYKWTGDRASNHKGVIETTVTEDPPAPKEGDYWNIIDTRTIGGVDFTAGDWAVYSGGKWMKQVEEITTSAPINRQKGVFVEFSSKIYYIDGKEIWEISYNEETDALEAAVIDPYVPNVMINCSPDLMECSNNESYNLLTSAYQLKFHGDNSTTVFKLTSNGSPIDNTQLVSVVVNGVDQTGGYTVTASTGTVTFDEPPSKGINNVWITAYQLRDPDEAQADKDKVVKCAVALAFGGESSGVDGGSRVFVMGNSDYPLCYWRSGLGVSQGVGMKYFPDTAMEMLDQNNEPITTAAKMAGEMIIFKEHSIFAVGYMFDGQNVYYPVRECHSRIGCDMPDSVQLIDNQLVFANSRNGVHMLISSSNKLENTVKPLSANINPLLLKESDLTDAVSCDYERYYWLYAGGHVYLWDYESTPYHNYSDYDKAQRRLAWYRFDSIHPNDFFAGDMLTYGSDVGLVRFIRYKNDFGNAYKSYYISKAFDLGAPNIKKTFMEVYPSFRGDGNVKATVTVGSDKTDTYMSKTVDIRTFSWDEFNWEAFTWNVVKFAKTFVMKLRMKLVSYIQIKVEGNEINRGVGLTGMRLTYFINGKMKR